MMILSSFILLSSTMVLLLRHPVHCLLALILSFLNFSLLLFSQGLYLLALAYIVVYVGAICVLFLFVILLLNLRVYALRQDSRTRKLVRVLFFSLFFFFLVSIIFQELSSPKENPMSLSPLCLINQKGPLNLFAESFFIYHFPYFILCVLLLLLGILAVISLSLEVFMDYKNQEKKNFKINIIF